MKPPVYIHVPQHASLSGAEQVIRAAKASVLTPLYWASAHLLDTPGLHIQARAFALGLRTLMTGRHPLPVREIIRVLAFPLDSVRYFEFDFVWAALRDLRLNRYLDVSSPRLLPMLLLAARPDLEADLLNPDGRDLETTEHFVRATRLEYRCRLQKATIADANLPSRTFDAITSVSVLEHIPGDANAVRAMWDCLAPGGRLLLTVPCANEEYEEYVSRDVYGVLQPQADGFTFWQRYYDQRRLEERIFPVTGLPIRTALFGEKTAGLYSRNVSQKLADPHYPAWREPYMVGLEYARFDSLSDLPGIGVIALEFVKGEKR
jgi:SAM-dependent methyltransferase